MCAVYLWFPFLCSFRCGVLVSCGLIIWLPSCGVLVCGSSFFVSLWCIFVVFDCMVMCVRCTSSWLQCLSLLLCVVIFFGGVRLLGFLGVVHVFLCFGFLDFLCGVMVFAVFEFVSYCEVYFFAVSVSLFVSLWCACFLMCFIR